MFSHEVQLGAIKLVAQSVEGLNSELFHITVAFAAFLVLVFAAEYINEKFQARRLEAFADTATVLEDNNMISNDKTNRNFNIFNLLRSFGYKAVDFLVAIPELGWVVGKELTVQSISFGWFALKGLLSGIKLVGQIAVFSLIMGLMISVLLIAGTAIAAKDAVVSGYRKVTGWFSAKKQERADKKAEDKAKAEAEAKAEFKAKAEAAGFVAADEVADMVAIAIEKAFAAQEQRKINLANVVTHAKAIVLKSVDEMDLAEMREELGVKGFNTNQLRAKVRAARANS